MTKKLDLPEQVCACGCGEIFAPSRRTQRFFSEPCRFKYHSDLAKEERAKVAAAKAKVCPHCGGAI